MKRKAPSRDPLLAEREKTHGDFAEQARVAQALKAVMRSAPNWGGLTAMEKEACEMKATKLARYLCGDSMEPDHLGDDIGYSKLILERASFKKSRNAGNGPRTR